MVRWKNHILIVIFVFFLILPVLAQAVSFLNGTRRDILIDENRMAVAFPSVKKYSNVPAFTADLETWITDHFGLRPVYLELFRSFRDELGLASGGQVIVGQDGWLFLNQADMIDEFQGYIVIKPETVNKLVVRFGQIASLTNNPTIFLFPPNKQTIYTEFLPSFIKKSSNSTRLERVLAVMKRSGLSFVDVVDEFVLQKPHYQIYHATDTHWTDWGAYLSYRQLMEKFIQNGLDVSVVEEEALEEVTRTTAFSGDLTIMLGSDLFAEMTPKVQVKKPVLSKRHQIEIANRPASTWPTVYTQELPGAPTIMISGDSFVTAMLPFLRESFSVITIVQRDSNTFYVSDFDDFSADVILIEMVERLLTVDIDIRP